MKHLKLLVAVVVLALVVVSLSFAGTSKGTTAKSQLQQTATRVKGDLRDSDIPGGRVKSTSNQIRDLIRKSPTIAKPVPNKMQLASITSGLSGNYNIPGDFASISNAVAVLNFVGL